MSDAIAHKYRFGRAGELLATWTGRENRNEVIENHNRPWALEAYQLFHNTLDPLAEQLENDANASQRLSAFKQPETPLLVELHRHLNQGTSLIHEDPRLRFEPHFHRFFRTTTHSAVTPEAAWTFITNDFLFYAKQLLQFEESLGQDLSSDDREEAFNDLKFFYEAIELYSALKAEESFLPDMQFRIGTLGAAYLYGIHQDLEQLKGSLDRANTRAQYLSEARALIHHRKTAKAMITALANVSTKQNHPTRVLAHQNLAELQTDNSISAQLFLLELLRAVGGVAAHSPHTLTFAIPRTHPNHLLILDSSFALFSADDNQAIQNAVLAIHPEASFTVEETDRDQQANGYQSRASLFIPAPTTAQGFNTGTPTHPASTHTRFGGWWGGTGGGSNLLALAPLIPGAFKLVI